MNFQDTDLIIAVFAVTIVILLLGSFGIIFTLIHKKKQLENKKEKSIIQSQFHPTLLQYQLEIQEQTFNDISQEIHDNVGQILSLAKVQINIMTEGNEIIPEMLNDVKNNIGKAMSDLRDIAKSLSNERINALTIHAAVLNETERISKSGVLRVHVNVVGEQNELNQQEK